MRVAVRDAFPVAVRWPLFRGHTRQQQLEEIGGRAPAARVPSCSACRQLAGLEIMARNASWLAVVWHTRLAVCACRARVMANNASCERR